MNTTNIPVARKSVRRAKEDDLKNIVSLHSKTIHHMRSLCPPGFGKAMQSPVIKEEEITYFREALQGSGSVLLVCETGGMFAGFALASTETFEDDLIDAPFMTVVFIETEPKFRRQGVARALLARLERTAKRMGLLAIELSVWMNNSSAISLYNSLGFTQLEMRMAKPLCHHHGKK